MTWHFNYKKKQIKWVTLSNTQKQAPHTHTQTPTHTIAFCFFSLSLSCVDLWFYARNTALSSMHDMPSSDAELSHLFLPGFTNEASARSSTSTPNHHHHHSHTRHPHPISIWIFNTARHNFMNYRGLSSFWFCPAQRVTSTHTHDHIYLTEAQPKAPK